MKIDKYPELTIDFDKVFGVKHLKIGVAVSGGGDSIALLLLIYKWAQETKKTILVATVNHDLKPTAEDEANQVSLFCSKLGILHSVLTWKNWDKKGNVQASARKARYQLLTKWAVENNISCVALGHNRDDVVENFFIRLSRGAGVDGLSQMLPSFELDNIIYLRPLIDVSREELRTFLKVTKNKWIEDPANDDQNFHRVRIRKSLSLLDQMDINTESVITASKNLRDASQALDIYTRVVAKECVSFKDGDIIFNVPLLLNHPIEIQRRLLLKAILFLAKSEFGPRSSELSNLMTSFSKYRPHTLKGFYFFPVEEKMRMSREYKAIEHYATKPNNVWDHRWYVKGPKLSKYCIRPLGEKALLGFTNWKNFGIPKYALISSPAVWDGNNLELSLFLERDNLWELSLNIKEKDFFGCD